MKWKTQSKLKIQTKKKEQRKRWSEHSMSLALFKWLFRMVLVTLKNEEKKLYFLKFHNQETGHKSKCFT
jgi:hypothetical protein